MIIHGKGGSPLGVAVVTGSSAGIGKVYADRLAKRGYDLVLIARRKERLEALARELKQKYGVQADTLVADLGNPADPTLQEPGCEVLFETSREGDPHKLVFFEIFLSSAAHKFHLEQDYTKRMLAALEGKLAGAPITTNLTAL